MFAYTCIKVVTGKYNEIPLSLWLIDLFSVFMLGIEYGVI